jgi:hypothetical protein
MARTLRHVGWLGLVLGGVLLGCTKLAVQPKQVPDPLLVTKTPVEGRPHAAQASPVHRITAPPTPPSETDSPSH